MSDEQTVQVSFGRPMPIFPLPGVTLMPHARHTLAVFEPRYRQLVRDALRTDRQFAMATFQGDAWKHDYHARPPVRPVVCIGVIVEHGELPDATMAIVVHGLCRARITEELEPDGAKLYRQAVLAPVDLEDPDEDALEPFRERLVDAMEHDRLADLRGAEGMVELLRNPEIPTSAIFEVLGYTFVADQTLRYRLLESEDPVERATLVSAELMDIQSTLRKAQPQRHVETPKGCSWN
jgi:Lon protease-like protein